MVSTSLFDDSDVRYSLSALSCCLIHGTSLVGICARVMNNQGEGELRALNASHASISDTELLLTTIV